MSRVLALTASMTAALMMASGCANPINAKTAERYHKAGAMAEYRSDLPLARENFRRMYINTQLGHLGPAAEALAMYEWARVSGYLGEREDAEGAFLKVLELIDAAKGEADSLRAPTLAEFARYLHDTQQHERALPIFHDAVGALDHCNAHESDPIGFAEFLDDYVDSLRQAGRALEAAAQSQRAVSLRAAHPGASPNYTPRRYPSG